MKRILHRSNKKKEPLMISCEQAAFLISKKQHVKLRLREQISLRMHVMMCKFCNLYEKEIKLISDKIKDYTRSEKSGQYESVKLSEAKKQEISKKIKDQLQS